MNSDLPSDLRSFDQEHARRIVLVEALDTADSGGLLVGAAERGQVERDAAAASRDAATGRLDAARYLRERSRRMLALLQGRNPRLAALQEPQHWRRWIAWALPLAACALGMAIDRLDNPDKVNMLSPPLLAVLVWNVAVYCAMLAGAVWPARAQPRTAPGTPLMQWLAGRIPRGRGNVRAEIASRFHLRWLQVAGRAQAQWLRQVLHASAAGWAVGLALSILLGGLVRDYRVGWESTLLDVRHVHAFLSVLFAPVVALLPFDAFTVAELQRMAFRSGVTLGMEESRRWLGLYLALLALVVVVPRTLLALYAAWRARALGKNIQLDLREPYYVELLDRVSPVRVQLALAPGDPQVRAVLLRTFAEAAGHPLALQQPPGGAQVVLVTAGGDTLELLLRDEDSTAGDAQLAQLPGVPVNWWHDDAFLAAVAKRLPARKQAGFARIAAHWQACNQERFSQAMRALARQLRDAAAQGGQVQGQPLSLRHMVSASEREADQQARQAAMTAVLARLHDAQAHSTAELLRLYRAGAPAPAEWQTPGAGLVLLQAVDSQHAGVAGALTGAGLGATVDVFTGGLTLGAAALVGAVVGGGAAWVAAAWKNKSTPSGASVVQPGDDMLATLTEDALLRYLAIIHRGGDAAPAPGWKSEVVAAVQEHRARLEPLWAAARAEGAAQDPLAGQPMADALQAIAQDLQRRLAPESAAVTPA